MWGRRGSLKGSAVLRLLSAVHGISGKRRGQEEGAGRGDGSAAKRGERGKAGWGKMRDGEAQRSWQRAVALGSQTPGSGRGDSAFPAGFDPPWLSAILSAILRTSVVPCQDS